MKRYGKELEKPLRTIIKHLGTFSYWNLIDELLSQRHQDSMAANAIEVGKEILSKSNHLDRGD